MHLQQPQQLRTGIAGGAYHTDSYHDVAARRLPLQAGEELPHAPFVRNVSILRMTDYLHAAALHAVNNGFVRCLSAQPLPVHRDLRTFHICGSLVPARPLGTAVSFVCAARSDIANALTDIAYCVYLVRIGSSIGTELQPASYEEASSVIRESIQVQRVRCTKPHTGHVTRTSNACGLLKRGVFSSGTPDEQHIRRWIRCLPALLARFFLYSVAYRRALAPPQCMASAILLVKTKVRVLNLDTGYFSSPQQSHPVRRDAEANYRNERLTAR